MTSISFKSHITNLFPLDYVFLTIEGGEKLSVPANRFLEVSDLFTKIFSAYASDETTPCDPDDPYTRFTCVQLKESNHLPAHSLEKVFRIFAKIIPANNVQTLNEEELRALICLGEQTLNYDEPVQTAFGQLLRLNSREKCPLDNKKLEQLCSGLSSNTEIVRLSIFNSDSVTDKVIEIIANRCPNLRKLDLANCIKVTNASIYYLSVHCKKLQELDLAYCSITDHFDIVTLQAIDLTRSPASRKSILALAANCPKIQWLDLSGCKAVDIDLIRILAQSLPKLDTLGVLDCIGIKSFQELTDIEREYPQLTIEWD